ncbi:hypothetical protein MRB53_041825 [Persea americana]|nr:hypothetical protein MRB53_041825 [Persea americana]
MSGARPFSSLQSLVARQASMRCSREIVGLELWRRDLQISLCWRGSRCSKIWPSDAVVDRYLSLRRLADAKGSRSEVRYSKWQLRTFRGCISCH